MSIAPRVFLQHREALEDGINAWRNSEGGAAATASPDALKDASVVVAVRTRPFLDSEREEIALRSGKEAGAGEKLWSDARACEALPGGRVVVHLPISRMRGPVIDSKTYQADVSIAADDGNDVAYDQLIAAPKLLETVLGGGVSCVLAYGQTGSGKTHTISALEKGIAGDLLPLSAAYAAQHFPSASAQDAADIFAFEASCYELLGGNATDLLAENDGVAVPVDIMEDVTGDIRTSALQVPFATAKELLDMISRATAHRRTSSTARNATSSRSHCIFTVQVRNKLFPGVPPGRLVMVDLAGSERAADRAEHGLERIAEGKLINQSLSVLKDCVRARALLGQSKAGDAFVHVPYRSSKLTLALKPMFDPETRLATKTVIVAHASPHLADAVHSSNTLKYIEPFRVPPAKNESSKDDPRGWTHEHFKRWVAGKSTKIDPAKLASGGEDGKAMAKLPEEEWIRRILQEACYAPGSVPRRGAEKFYALFWKTLIDAKNAKLSENTGSAQDRMTRQGPRGWTPYQLQDWLAALQPPIDVDVVAPLPTKGKVLMDDGEASFIAKMQQAGADLQQAQQVWRTLWDLQVNALTGDRSRIMKRRKGEISSAEKEMEQLLHDISNTPVPAVPEENLPPADPRIAAFSAHVSNVDRMRALAYAR